MRTIVEWHVSGLAIKRFKMLAALAQRRKDKMRLCGVYSRNGTDATITSNECVYLQVMTSSPSPIDVWNSNGRVVQSIASLSSSANVHLVSARSPAVRADLV